MSADPNPPHANPPRRQISHSGPGAELVRLLRAAGLADTRPNIRVRAGGRLWSLDHGSATLRIGVDLQRRPPDTAEENLLRVKHSALSGAGWLYMNLPRARLRHEPQRVLAELQAAVQARS